MNELFCSSVIGARHIKAGTPKEDFGLIKQTDICKVFVLGDGHGDPDCFRSQIGSETICKLTVEAFESFAETANPDDLLHDTSCDSIVRHFVNYLFGTWKGNVLYQLEENPFTEKETAYMEEARQKGSNTVDAYDHGIQLEHIFGTTFIAGVLTDKYLLLLHQGDGRCTVMHSNGEYSEPVPWDDRCYDNLTTSICDTDAVESCRYKIFDLSKEQILACIISSDGVEDQLACDSDLVHSYFDELILYGIENGTDALCNYLEETLPEMTKNGNGDDITICGFYNPELIEPFKKSFSTRKQLIKVQSQLESVMLKLDSINRSGKMEMLKQRHETAEKKCSEIKEKYDLKVNEKEQIERDLINFQSETSDNSDFSIFSKALNTIINNLGAGTFVSGSGKRFAEAGQKFVEDLIQAQQSIDILKSELEEAELLLQKCKDELDAYSARKNSLLDRKDELEEQIKILKAI